MAFTTELTIRGRTYPTAYVNIEQYKHTQQTVSASYVRGKTKLHGLQG